jgi:hypothetical protein
MAQNYSAWKLTDQFANAEAAASASGNQITWVRIIASSDQLQASDLASLTDAILDTIHINQETPISNVVVKANTVTITGILSSAQNDADYYANTLLLIGSYNGQEFVAGGTIATGQATRVPAADANEYTEFTVRPQIVVSKASTISTTVNPIAGATNERVDNEVAQIQSQIDTINDYNDTQDTTIAGMVSKALNETITGIKTFTQNIVGNITGNAGSATKLQTSRTINGVPFNGTANINVNAANDSDLVHKTEVAETIAGDKTFTGDTSVSNLVVSGSLDAMINVKPWQPNTYYQQGDLVFIKSLGSSTTGRLTNALFMAREDHTSGSVFEAGRGNDGLQYANPHFLLLNPEAYYRTQTVDSGIGVIFRTVRIGSGVEFSTTGSFTQGIFKGSTIEYIRDYPLYSTTTIGRWTKSAGADNTKFLIVSSGGGEISPYADYDTGGFTTNSHWNTNDYADWDAGVPTN